MWPQNRFGTRKSTSVLVSNVGPELATLSEADFSAYSRYYPKCKLESVTDVPKLFEIATKGFHIIHLLCRISDSGLILDEQVSNVACSRLLDETYRHGTQVLFIAGENSKKAYINGIKLSGRNMNIVMTLDRRGDAFATFLASLTSYMAAGEPIVRAWAKVAPQVHHGSNSNLPVCILAAGLPNVVFLP